MALRPKTATSTEDRSTDLISTEEENILEAEDQSFIVVTTTCDLYEPYEHIRFYKDQLTQVSKITNWMQCQIEASLMKIT